MPGTDPQHDPLAGAPEPTEYRVKHVTTIAEEKAADGWAGVNRPMDPAPASTSSTRGMADTKAAGE